MLAHPNDVSREDIEVEVAKEERRIASHHLVDGLVFPIRIDPVLRASSMLAYLRHRFGAPIPDDVLRRIETLPVSRLERFEVRVGNRPQGILGELPSYWCHYRRLRRDGQLSWPLGFPRYLQQVWRLPSRDLLLHASAFAVGRRGVVIAGPKKAGKTTLLVHALHRGSPEYVSNDRVLVTDEASPCAIRVPTVVRMRRGTLDLFPVLAYRVDSARYEPRLALDERAEHTEPTSASPNGARRVSHAQLCRTMGVRARPECMIAALVFPRITEEPGTFELRRLDPAEVVTRLEGALFGAPGGRSTSDVFVLPEDPPAPDARAISNALPYARGPRARSRVPAGHERLEGPIGDDLIETLLAG